MNEPQQPRPVSPSASDRPRRDDSNDGWRTPIEKMPLWLVIVSFLAANITMGRSISLDRKIRLSYLITFIIVLLAAAGYFGWYWWTR